MNRSLFAQRHPYWFAVLLEIGVILVYLLAGTVAHFLNLSSLAIYGIANVGLTAISALLLTVMGWWKVVGFRSPDHPRDLLYFALPFFPAFINLFPGVEVSSLLFLVEIMAITLMVGFVEETIFRGLMLNALKAHGYWKAAVVTALFFGLTHALNVLTGKSVVDDVLQIVYALAIGFAYAALVLKKGILWPLVVAHFSIDFIYFAQKPGFAYPPGWDTLIVIGITGIFTAYGIFLMLQKSNATVVQPVAGRA